MAGERLTIDVTVIGDLCGDPEKRSGHASARALVELAVAGEVEIAVAPQGWRLDVPDGEWKTRLDELIVDGTVTQMPQLAYPSEVTFPGADLIPGHVVKGLPQAWAMVSASWGTHDGKEPPGDEDRLHVETHIAEGRDVFLSSDYPLRSMCRHLCDEHGFAIKAMTVACFLATRATTSDPGGRTLT